MNISYNILWIDDSDDYVESTLELIQNTIRNNYMEPQIQNYSSYDEFKEKELNNFDEQVFSCYDQILVDYALSGSTGDEIIKQIRTRNIFTDIVFYSSNYESMIEEIKDKGQLDGVFFAKRENLLSVINNVIKKNLKREFNIANIRGLIMDGTTEFDFICRTVSKILYNKLPEKKQVEIIEAAFSFMNKASNNSKKNFKELTDYKQKDHKKFFNKILDSVDYVMDNKDRYKLMTTIVKEFDFGKDFEESFAEQYSYDLIKPRNDLAHCKLYYGECKKKLHIAKEKGKYACNKECQNCRSKYDVAKCERIRSLLFEYYKILNKLDIETDNINRSDTI